MVGAGRPMETRSRGVIRDFHSHLLPPMANTHHRFLNEGVVMMGSRQRMGSGDEWDALYARKMYCYLQRPGVSSKIKRRMRRRRRRERYEEGT